MLRNFSLYPAMGSIAKFKVVVRSGRSHWICYVESYSRGLYPRLGDKLGGCCKNPGKR